MTDLAKFPSAHQARWSSGFPTLATSGAVFLDGPQWGEWEGRLAVATLKTKSLRVFEFTEQGDFAGQIVVPELDGSHGRLRTPVLGPDGALYIATSNRPGSDRILRVSANRAATGAPFIVGTSRVGETLTADTSGITDDDGLTNAVFSYQWVSNDGNADTDIDGETGSTYELSDDDVGKTVKVRVSFTDDAGNEESLTSVPTTAVAPSNHQPEVVPRLREWAGGSGSFALSGSSRVVVVAGDGSRQFSGDFFSIVLGGLTDPEESGLSEAQRSAARLALADSLNATAYHTASRRTLDQVAAKIRDDIEDLTGLSLAVVPASASVSPRAGDVVVDVLDASDAGIAAEGYELAIGDWVTIRANSTSGVFYGSRTLLQMLAGSGDNTAPRGTARDYPTLGHRLIHLDMNRKYWEMDYLADSFRRMSWVKLNAFKIHFADANGWRLHDPGTAAWSGTMSAAPTPDTATEVLATGSLGASTGVKVVPGARSLTVHWNPPSVQSGRDVRSYRVQIRRQGDLAWSPADYRDSAGAGTAYLTVADRSHKFGGLTDGVTYEVRVSADTGFPGLADSRERYQSGDKKWFYDRDDIRMLEGWAAENHISIMPGFEFPGHTSVINDLYETGFADGGSDRCGNAHVYGNVKPGFVLDTTSSRAVAQAKTIMEHFMPWFSGLYVHIGGEEVSAKLANCPRVAAHIKASSSVSSLGDMLTVFFNDLNELVRHTDRSMIIYNGVEHLDPDTNVAQLDSTVVVMDWNARSYSYYGGPPGSSGARHKFMKMRASDGYYLTSNNFHALYPEESRLYDRWDVEPPETYLGAAIGVWLDYIYWSRDEYTELLLLRPRAILGDRTWNGSTTPDTVNDFYARLKVIGEPPGYEGFTERTRVDDGLPSHHYGFEDDTEVFPPTHFKNLRHGRTHLVRDEAGELHATSYNVTSPSVSADDKRFGASSWEFSKDGHGAGIGGVDIPAPWTMSIWVKRTADRVGAALMSSRSPAGERRYIRLQRSGTQVGIDDRKGLGCSFDYSTPLSEWTHLAFVADTATITLYVNGVPQSATCASMPLPMGAISARGNDSLRAYLDELKIWDETLSREQVERLAVSEAVSLPGPLTGFTVVDASDQTVVGRLAEGATLTLDDPASGSYGIRVDTESGAQIGSVRLELSGRKTVSRTENITPYSLHGDGGDGALHGEPLPAGSYTLRATAYEEQDLGGDVLGTLEVSFTVAAANTPATGAPTIGGTAQAGATLTADTSGIADADGLTNAVFSYQWIANDGNADTDIENETGSTYELSDDDVGKTIKVRVSFTDDADNQETLTSAATATVAARPNSPATGLPTISGTAQVDETLTADVSSIADADGLTNVSYSYQWLADEANIQSATNPTYTLADSDEGKAIKVKVSFTDDSNNEETLTSVATAAVAPRSVDIVEDEAAPLWSADMLVVEYTSVSIGAASADLFSHVWGSAGLQIKSLWSFTPDRDLRLEFQEAVPGAADLTMQVGDLALAFPAGSSGQSSFRWTDVDVDWEDGQTISVRIVPTSAVAARPNSPATGQPTISGTAQVGETLTADTSGIADADGLTNATFSYQWMAGGSDIPGATASSYTLTSSEQGQTIQVQVSFTDDADNEETLTSAATAAVAAKPNTPATGAPTISGTPQVGETLTADTSGIADTDGLTNVSYSYQWLADDANIDGATGSTYILANSDEGKAIKVRVSFTDDADNQETLTSAATAAVAAKPNSLATGAPTISGTVQVGETLTADTSGIDDADGLTNVSYSYQWIAGGEADIDGATGSSHTLTTSEQGQTIQVQVSFTDDQNNEETLTSAATAAVAGAATVPGEPEHLNVSPHDDQGLDLYWEAPASDGGSPITGYKVQWKEAANSWDTEADVSEEAVTGTTHTINGLTEGVEYAVRVMATNEVGDGPASAENTGIPRETKAPEMVRPRVDGATLKVLYDEALDEGSAPPTDSFDVRVACTCDDTTWLDEEAKRAVESVSVDGDTVVLTLVSAATSEDVVVVSYTPPSDAATARTRDLAGNAAAGFNSTEVFNDTDETAESEENGEPGETPLTVSLEATTESHNGTDAFTFEIRFSEEFPLSYKTLRDLAFTVSGGEVLKAQRLDKPSNIRWLITVEPDSNGDVAVVLPVTQNCASDGAICTGDGRKLSTRLELTVSGPGQ